MEQAGEILPVRLRPRKRSQVPLLILFGFFFVFAIIWTIATSQPGAKLEFNDAPVTDPYWRGLFPYIGVPFALIGACGLAVAVLKMLPNSPCYYLDLSPDGLTLRTLFKTRRFAWRDLPPFTSLREESSSDDSTTITYYAVAMADAGDNPREVLRISASEYGTKNNEQSANDLAARLNRIRESALPAPVGTDARTSSKSDSLGAPPASKATMEQVHRTLPIRLLPRREWQAAGLIGSLLLTGVPLYWMAKHGGLLEANRPTLEAAFRQIGTMQFLVLSLFAFMGAKGLSKAIVKLLPGSPFYYLEIGSEGLVRRALFKRKRYAWRDLPPFDTLRVVRETKDGKSIDYYTVAMEGLPTPASLKAGESYQREVLRIFADEYGAKNEEQDAKDLAAWLNDLRSRARDNRLMPNEQVQVPGSFAALAISVAGPGRGNAGRVPTVVRHPRSPAS